MKYKTYKLFLFIFVLLLIAGCTNGIISVTNLYSNNLSLQYYCGSQAFVLGNFNSAIPSSSTSGASYSVSPNLPPGLSIDSSTGIIAGTPTTVTILTPYLITANLNGSTSTATLNIRTDHGFVVNSLADTTDVSPGNFICADASGNCTLRAAIGEINAEGSPYAVVLLPSGTISILTAALGANNPINVFGSCSGSQSILDGGNSVAPVFSSTYGSGSLNNLIVQHGSGTSGGAGVSIFSSGPQTFSLNYVVIQNNTSTSGLGGGVSFTSNGGILNVTYSKIQNNTSSAGGGGIYFSSAATTLNVTSSTFTSNQSTTSNGGGIFFAGVNMNVNSSSFLNNSASSTGGGLQAAQGTTTINSSNFTGNSALVGGAVGNNSSGILYIYTSNFSGNTAGSGGAIGQNSGTPITAIYQSDLVNNTATTAGGGAFYASVGSATIANSTIAYNRSTAAAGFGGGIAMLSGTSVVMTNNTVAFNSNPNNTLNGAGFYAASATYTLTNNIFSNNTSLSGTINSCNTPTGGTSNGYNIFDDSGYCASVGADYTLTSASLGPLQNNGGLTLTMAPGSVAVNHGLFSACNAAPINGVDQTGKSRITNGYCDIGAFEVSP